MFANSETFFTLLCTAGYVYENCRKKYEVCCLLAVVEKLCFLNVVAPHRNDILLLKNMA